MLVVLSAIVALGCVLASARRLEWAVAPTAFDAGLLLDALEEAGEARWRALGDAVLREPGPTWERDLFQALTEEASGRESLVVEQLLELDWLAQRWARVPRVCASIATSAGFLFGCMALLQGLALPVGDGFGVAAGGALLSGLSALSVGIAGTSFCVAVHLRAGRIAKARIVSVERLVSRLQEMELALALDSSRKATA